MALDRNGDGLAPLIAPHEWRAVVATHGDDEPGGYELAPTPWRAVQTAVSPALRGRPSTPFRYEDQGL